MKNNKGFIISTTLYSAFGIMMITVASILFVLSSKTATMSSMTDKLKLCIEECNTPENICDGMDGKDIPLHKILADNELKTTPLITKDSCAEGLFADVDNDGISIFYRGNVDNNYIKYGKNQYGNDILWRIVRLNGDGSLRLITNENVKYSLLDVNGNEIEIDGENDTISKLHNASYNDVKNYGTIYYNLVYNNNTTCYNATPSSRRYITYDKVVSKSEDYSFNITFDKEKSLNLNIKYNDIVYNNNSELTLYNKLSEYYINNVIKLDEKLESNGKYCSTGYWHDSSYRAQTYVPNENLKCDNNIAGLVSYINYYGENSITNNNIGLLSYGEYLMGTNIAESCELDSGFL